MILPDLATKNTNLRVAIVHDWLTGMRGGEAILDAICELYPEADLYTLLQTDYHMSDKILNGRMVKTSFLQKFMKLPRFQSGYRSLLPLFPKAIAGFDLSSYDLVLSNSTCVAKAVKVGLHTKHLSYISSPMRYVWDMYDEYFGPGKSSALVSLAASIARKPLQDWDKSTNEDVDLFLANSNFVKNRIYNCWQKDSVVVHPFMEPEKFIDKFEKPGDYYLILSAFAPYKRIDLAVDVFKENKKNLIIIGKGQDEYKLRAKAKGFSNIRFLGALSDEAIGEFYRKAKAFLFPGLEDFGITPLESLYNGRPVIAYGKGGILDTMTCDTAIFFKEQTVSALSEAVDKMEDQYMQYDSSVLRKQSMQFSRDRFLHSYIASLNSLFE
ncbi:MAG: glycosyltransferase [Oligoflexia bacterium]|nr:glycosyltransferase [Oligoflexia bacterium]